MAVTSDTLNVLDGLRRAVSRAVDETERDVIRSWTAAWETLQGEWVDALTGLDLADVDSVRRARRVRAALTATRASLGELCDTLGVRLVGQVGPLAALSAEGEAALLASQAPPTGRYQTAGVFDRVDRDELRAVVERCTQRVTALTRLLPARVTTTVKRELFAAVALGRGPGDMVDRVVARVGTGFTGGQTRLLVIARTELLDVHRAATFAQDQANRATLAGWQWQATFDRRTCPSCLAMHGRVFPVDQRGPEDHQQGRCARLPKLRSWRELGFAIPEPDDVARDARAWFDGLPRNQRVAMLGQTRVDLLDQGRISWADMAQQRTNPGWRDSWAPAPTGDLLRRAAA